jgi:FtsH-binding integral membrane protein
MYYTISFIIVAVFIVLAVVFWGRGLMNLYRSREKARNLLSTGFMIGLWGLVLALIVFGFFNL